MLYNSKSYFQRDDAFNYENSSDTKNNSRFPVVFWQVNSTVLPYYPDLSPNLYPCPPLNEDVTKTAILMEDKTSRLTQTRHHHQDRHLNADSEHRHHLLHQDKTESLHHNKQNTETEMDCG